MTTRGTGPAGDPEPPAPEGAGRGSRIFGNRAVLVSSASTMLFFAVVALVVALAPGSGLVAERFFSPFHLWQSLRGTESEPGVLGAFLLNVYIFAISEVFILVFALALFITSYYHHLQDPSFHQNAYAILTAVVLIRSIWIMETNMRPYFRSRHKERRESWGNAAIAEQDRAEQQRQDDRDRWILVRMWSLIALGLSIFVGGFGIWTLDNEYCSKVRQWRHEIGLPWGVLLEGHGW